MSDPTASDKQQKKLITNIPKPRPFHISDPFQDRGLWCFWLTADEEVLQFVSNLSCILQPTNASPFQRRLRGRVLFAIDPRYDHEETWLWITDMLESEANQVELDVRWENALIKAYSSETHDGS